MASMSAIAFDTLKFAERLEKAGLTREQAAAIVETQKDAMADALDTTLATKADIRAVRDDLTAIDRRMDGLDAKFDKLSWMLGILIALALANFAKQFF